MCGLKLERLGGGQRGPESHPSRVCGLKQLVITSNKRKFYVTPLAGVWIETGVQLRQCGRGDVTPLAGVWIETP